MQSRCNIGLI